MTTAFNIGNLVSVIGADPDGLIVKKVGRVAWAVALGRGRVALTLTPADAPVETEDEGFEVDANVEDVIVIS